MFKKYLAQLVGRLLDQIGTNDIIEGWVTVLNAIRGDWGFNPGTIESYDLAKNLGPFAMGMYHVAQEACEGLHSDYHDLYVSAGRSKWGYEVFEGHGRLYKLVTEAF